MNATELKVEMVRHNDTTLSLAKALGITRGTLYKKINNDNADFTQGEISAIKDLYNLSGDRIEEIFFNKEVS